MTTINDRRAVALAAFNSAQANPATADWQAIATTLASLIPASKSADLVDVSDMWIDYAVPRNAKLIWPSPIVRVLFEDGIVKRAGALTIKGRPTNWGRAVRHAVSFHSNDGARLSAPIISVTCEATGKIFDAAIAEQKTGFWARCGRLAA